MNNTHNRDESEPRTVLQAKLRMALFLLLIFIINIVEAHLTFPFVDHTTSTQNVVYGLVVTAPFYVALAAFMVVIWKDLASS